MEASQGKVIRASAPLRCGGCFQGKAEFLQHVYIQPDALTHRLPTEYKSIQTDAYHLHKPSMQKGVFTFLHS